MSLQGKFFFSLLATWLYLSLGQVYFWFAVMLAGKALGIPGLLEGVWLDNMYSLHLNLDFLSCVLHYIWKQLWGHQFWHLLKGWKQMEHSVPFLVSSLYLILFSEDFYILRSKMAFTLTQGIMCNILPQTETVSPRPPIWLC